MGIDRIDEALSIREAARFALIRRSVDDDEALTRACRSALELSAETLNVQRVGIWMYEEGGAVIRCTLLFDRRDRSAAPGETITLAACPRYADALQTRRVVMAEDARSDPRTNELSEYLLRHDIVGLLDCPVFLQGDVVGVVCHEQVGTPRPWTSEDSHFAATVADMLGLYLEQRATQQHYQALLHAREELEQRRVMASLGRMAANVAHDFNNVLLAVQLRTEFLRKTPPSADRGDAGADLLQIVEQGRRLVRHLLDFATQGRQPESVIDLRAVLDAMRPSVLAFAAPGVNLEIALPDGSVWARFERTDVEQIVMNLVKNARDAVVGGGTISVTLTHETDRLSGPGRATLSVRDTGVGMDAETRERAIEPFFTTKERGEGDGLGLSTVYALVAAAGGEVTITSALGEGAEVRLTVPCVATP